MKPLLAIYVISSKQNAMGPQTLISYLETSNAMVEEAIKYEDDELFQKELENNIYLQAFMSGVDEFKKSEVNY